MLALPHEGTQGNGRHGRRIRGADGAPRPARRSRRTERLFSPGRPSAISTAANIDPAAGKGARVSGRSSASPKNVDGTLHFRDLDEARRAAPPPLKGGEDPAFFAATERTLRDRERYTAETGAGFIAGDERLRRIKDDGMTGEVANEKEFLQAKAVYADRMSLVRGYVLRSMRFLRWLSSGKGLDGGAIVASLKARAAANREYLAFADKLAAGGEALSSLGSPVLKRRYALAARNIERSSRRRQFISLDKKRAALLTPPLCRGARHTGRIQGTDQILTRRQRRPPGRVFTKRRGVG